MSTSETTDHSATDELAADAAASIGSGKDVAPQALQQPVSDAPGFDDLESLNDSLDDVITLLEREIDRLKTSLEIYRESRHPDRQEIVRMHVAALDRRQDALDDMKALLSERR